MTDATPLASEQITQAGRFLLDRLVDHEVRMTSDEDARGWFGHVAPAMARFRSALSATPAPSDQDASQGEGEEYAEGILLPPGTVDDQQYMDGWLDGQTYLLMNQRAAAPGATAQDGEYTAAASNEAFLDAIHKATPTGQWIAVQHAPDGSGWSVALHPLPWLPGGEVAVKTTPTIPAGMVAPDGNGQPRDWDGGRVMKRNGSVDLHDNKPKGRWAHGYLGKHDLDIIAYTPLAAAPKQADPQGDA